MATSTQAPRTALERAASHADARALDAQARITTPERVVFDYPLAGPFHRAVSLLIDFSVIVLTLVAVQIAALIMSLGLFAGSQALLLIVVFVLSWGYQAFCEAIFNGRTIGKRAMGLRVLSEQGVAISATQAVIRNIVGAADGPLPFFFLPGLATMFLTRRFQRLGDLAAGTIVVIEQTRRRSGVVRIDDPLVTRLLPWLPLRIGAGPDLARALSDYVRARERFGAARREEMAERLAHPLRLRYGLPAQAPADTVLCAVYHRVFIGE